jgi:hypothetical protein
MGKITDLKKAGFRAVQQCFSHEKGFVPPSDAPLPTSEANLVDVLDEPSWGKTPSGFVFYMRKACFYTN